MNMKMIAYTLGRMLGVEAVVLLLPALVAGIYQESLMPFIITSAILMVPFLMFGVRKPKDSTIYGKEGFVIIASAWIFWSAFGALPFYFSGEIPSYIDALFETISGFTTTGSTILTDIEAISYGLNFWRCLTHWIGGMGVLVFVLTLVSIEDKHSMHLMRAEVPGPEKDKLVPKAKDSARILYIMYFVLTAVEVLFLLCGGMNLYESVIHSFSTAGTGGFSNQQLSIGAYNNAYFDAVITVFMILFGINFNIFYLLILRKFKAALKNEEMWIYLGIILMASLAIMFNISKLYDGNLLQSFRYSAFQVAAMITTTGYATADFNLWPHFSQCILLGVMFIGACAGSTGGGMKVSRVMILLRSVKQEIKRIIHPKSVNVVRVNGKKIGEDTIRGAYVYLVAYITIMLGTILLVSLDPITNFPTSVSSVITTLNNVGPGIDIVGPMGGFADFSPFSKLVFCFNMLVGRLEIFPFLILLSPSLWRKKF